MYKEWKNTKMKPWYTMVNCILSHLAEGVPISRLPLYYMNGYKNSSNIAVEC